MNQVTVTDKHTIEAMKQLAPALANKAIEIALEEQATQDQFITADEARALGVGNAEWQGASGAWYPCSDGCSYNVNWDNAVIKYRAIRKEVPAEPTFSGLKKVSTEKLVPAWQKLLHDNLWWELYESDKPAAPHAELKAMYAQQVKDGTLWGYDWEFKNGMVEWLSIKTDLGIFHACNEYRCTPKATCQVRNGDTGELKTMMRESAQKLQAETKDVCDWFLDGLEFTGDPEFDSEGIYTYKLKSNLVKLDSILITREDAIAIWESKKDMCDMWYHSDNTDGVEILNGFTGYGAWDWNAYGTQNAEYQLRPKAKKQVSLDPAIREGVIALLQELNFIK